MTIDLVRTRLFVLHLKHGAKMIPFAGFEMPVQYGQGVLKEHLHTRRKAGRFDVSHMGQVILRAQSYTELSEEFEKLIPMEVKALKEGRQRYGFFTNDMFSCFCHTNCLSTVQCIRGDNVHCIDVRIIF